MSLAPVAEAPAQVAVAIDKASKATGVPFEYLLATAARESSFRPGAKARDSSAAGLFQFIECTWLKTVKEEGARFGLGAYADQIVQTRSGQYVATSARARSEILKLRYDPEISAGMAGAFTQGNAEILGERLGREPSAGELYIAHFMGADRGAQLIDMAQRAPGQRADNYFPKAARANRSIFYAAGRARSMAEVYGALVKKHDVVEVAYKPWSPDTVLSAALHDGEEDLPSQGEPTKVASLTDPMLDVAPTATDALGSAGAWSAIARESRNQPTAIAVPAEATIPLPTRAPEAPVEARVRRAAPVRAPAPRKTRRSVPHQAAHAAAAHRLKKPQPSRVNLASSSFKFFDDGFWNDLGRMR